MSQKYQLKSSLKEKVFAVVKKIPIGRTLTYRQVAKLAGAPRAYRAVGNILHTNYDLSIPCHRVIRADGKSGGYNRGLKRKKELLKREGLSMAYRGDLILGAGDTDADNLAGAVF